MEVLVIGYIAVCIIATTYIIILLRRNGRQQFIIENLREIINSKLDYKVEIEEGGHMIYEPGSSASTSVIVKQDKIVEYTPMTNYTTQIFKK